ncbi:hypothetical protein K2173_009680 [Erythroxylum novogranatense]|uniref:Exocyst complex component n=1 Tax=Erythroxylum novogranatense TaxID=1862640 RepID=A0AAV8U7V4_9ROSI|nr:hypothetical protein K2173_009680 [Erythroxylum novogranatense]
MARTSDPSSAKPLQAAGQTLLHNLRHFARSKESEIEEVCKAHYQDFILAVDDLRSLLSDVDSLKSALSDSNSKLQFVAGPLLASLDYYLEAQTVSQNVHLALSQIAICIKLMELCARTNHHLSSGKFYLALKCADAIESEFLDKTPSSTLKAMLEKKIPEIRSYIERKDYVSLLGVTLRRYGYPVDALLDVLSKHRDKYHELLLSDCRKQTAEALSADKFEQMLMKKEYEYSMNVLSFHLQTSDIVPAFPYVAPFSSTVPNCCRIVRSFIEDSLEFFDVVKKYLDRLLSEVLDGALVKLINTSVHGVSQAMQVAANMAVMERACDFFFRHAAQLSGFPLTNARDKAEEMLSGLLKEKVDGFMTLIENVNWMADEPIQNGNEYVNEVIIYLETLVSTAQQILPTNVLKRVLQDILSHISEQIVGALLSDSVKKFNVNAVTGIDVDVRLLESFADSQSTLFTEGEVSQLKIALAEARQLINLLLSNHPENFLNPVIRERSYNALDYRKVMIISEKVKDSTERLFGTFGSRGTRQNQRK